MSRLSSYADYHTFITKASDLILSNSDILLAKNYDPAELVASLKAELESANVAENEQLDAHRIAKEKTDLAKDAIDEAYTSTSQAIDLVSGYLGKNHPLVKELKALRN